MSDTLLIIEDEALLGEELQRHYRRNAWDVVWVQTFAMAEKVLLEQSLEPLVVLSDISLPDGNGLDLLEKVRKNKLSSEWIFLTGYGDVPDSVRAMRLGAFDFLTKPCKKERLDLVITGAARSASAQRRLHEERYARSTRYTPESFIGHSAAARTVREMLLRLTEVPFTILTITGETGTGKGLAARILHHSGMRSEGPLVEINCATLPRELLESELFGHELGAFTGARTRRRGLMEQANGGTLFLDEISELDTDLQTKLLKVIEDRTLRRLGGNQEISLDIQVLAASNQNLEKRVSEGAFRADLFHRLNVFRLEIPPLRERREDLQDLVPVIIAEYNAKAGKNVKVVPAAVQESLEAHTWPGNVRELRNVIERGVLFSTDEVFPIEWLQLNSTRNFEPEQKQRVDGNTLTLPLDGTMGLDDMVRSIVQATLARHNNNVAATSRTLNTTREKIRYRIQKYNLNMPE